MTTTLPANLEAALDLRGRDYCPVAIHPKGATISNPDGTQKVSSGKNPIGAAWGAGQWSAEKIRQKFRATPGAGVGLCLGPGKAPAGRWLLDLEGDGPQAVESLTRLLGGTVATMGWGSTRGSHNLFVADARRASDSLRCWSKPKPKRPRGRQERSVEACRAPRPGIPHRWIQVGQRPVKQCQVWFRQPKGITASRANGMPARQSRQSCPRPPSRFLRKSLGKRLRGQSDPCDAQRRYASPKDSPPSYRRFGRGSGNCLSCHHRAGNQRSERFEQDFRRGLQSRSGVRPATRHRIPANQGPLQPAVRSAVVGCRAAAQGRGCVQRRAAPRVSPRCESTKPVGALAQRIRASSGKPSDGHPHSRPAYRRGANRRGTTKRR